LKRKNPEYLKKLIFTLNETIEKWNFLKKLNDYTPFIKKDKKINT
jgi:hypothetical protein